MIRRIMAKKLTHLDEAGRARSFDGVEILAALTDEQRAELARASRSLLYAAGEVIVAEGDAGNSMFVVARGKASVTLSQTEGELAALGEGAAVGGAGVVAGGGEVEGDEGGAVNGDGDDAAGVAVKGRERDEGGEGAAGEEGADAVGEAGDEFLGGRFGVRGLGRGHGFPLVGRRGSLIRSVGRRVGG